MAPKPAEHVAVKRHLCMDSQPVSTSFSIRYFFGHKGVTYQDGALTCRDCAHSIKVYCGVTGEPRNEMRHYIMSGKRYRNRRRRRKKWISPLRDPTSLNAATYSTPQPGINTYFNRSYLIIHHCNYSLIFVLTQGIRALLTGE